MTYKSPLNDRLSDYIEALAAGFSSACMAQAERVCTLQVGGLEVALHIAGVELEQALVPALAHLLTTRGASDAPNLSFYLWEASKTGVWPVQPPFNRDDYRRYGQRAAACAGSVALMHAPAANILFAYDRSTHRGYCWMADVGQLSIYERAAPLQTLFHWALAEHGWQVIHAAAVGSEEGGVLLIGNTGAGKSTTALSCLAEDGVKFLSDDKCLMRLEPEPRAFALFCSAKIKVDMLERLPHFQPLLAGWDDSYKANKGLVYLHPTYADHMFVSFPIKALILPQVTHQEQAVVRRTEPSDVFRQLGPSTVIWLPGAEIDSYHFTAEMARRLPCYRLELASKPERNAAALHELLRAL